MIGTRLGKWVLDRELGRGGMGTVYLARDGDARPAAVKVLAQELTTHSGAVSRFRREIEVLGKLDHPNIVRFHESGEHEGLLYFVMEYIDGADFADLLRGNGRLSWQESLYAGVQICGALKHAHANGVVHRDLKPSNLIRTSDGLVKLTDFGVAHVFSAQHLTRPGAVVGTAEYLSPEQAAGKPATGRSDLYSLGVVLYTLITGRNPFTGPNVVDILHKHRYAQFDRPGKFARDLPPDFEEVICQLLEKEPDRRPPDAGVLQRRLEAMRVRYSRQDGQTYSGVSTAPTHAGARTSDGPGDDASSIIPLAPATPPSRPGPEGEATFVSRYVRAELESQNRGGPARRFLNHPAVLVTLLALCVGALTWTFWPEGEEKLFARGQALMESEDPQRWREAWERYLAPLEAKFPGHAHKEEVAEYRKKLEEYETDRQRPRLSEAEWFYYRGLRRWQNGDADGARAIWENVARAFRGVPGEAPWAVKAEKALAADGAPGDSGRASVKAALERVQRLRDKGEDKEADEVMKSLKALYKDDPSAADMLK